MEGSTTRNLGDSETRVEERIEAHHRPLGSKNTAWAHRVCLIFEPVFYTQTPKLPKPDWRPMRPRACRGGNGAILYGRNHRRKKDFCASPWFGTGREVLVGLNEWIPFSDDRRFAIGGDAARVGICWLHRAISLLALARRPTLSCMSASVLCARARRPDAADVPSLRR